MKNELIIYHGSENIIQVPEYGKGKPYNDYGLGFYCTEYIELAKEWACDDKHGGYANKYVLDMTGLKILDLSNKKYSILLKNRQITIDNEFANSTKEYILKNFPVETIGYDIIKGYRADDSYFSYAKDFLQNGISVRRLSQVMKLGNLGNQIVLISPKAFSQIKFIGNEEAPQKKHFPLRNKRDELARLSYLKDKRGNSLDLNDLFIIDIIRGEIKGNDPRLQ